MNFQEEYRNLKANWRKRILISFYIVAAIVFAAEMATWIAMAVSGRLAEGGLRYALMHVVFPSALNLCVLLLTGGFIKRTDDERKKNFAIVFSLLCICLIVATFHGYILIVSCIFVTPIAVSAVFDDIKLTRLTTVFAMLSLAISIGITGCFDDAWAEPRRLISNLASFVFVAAFYVICTQLLQFSEQKDEMLQSGCLLNEEMRRALKVDAMTGLYNHTEFYSRLEQYYEDFHEQTTHLTVAVLDVDYFKQVNDAYGHECGDTVLIQIAGILKKYCGGCGHIFRYGGEEFAAIFRHMSAEDVEKLMNKVRDAINALHFDSMPEEKLGISCGIYEYMGDDTAVQEIFSRADKALYRAKKLGRNRCVCYSEDIQ